MLLYSSVPLDVSVLKHQLEQFSATNSTLAFLIPAILAFFRPLLFYLLVLVCKYIWKVKYVIFSHNKHKLGYGNGVFLVPNNLCLHT